MPVQYTPLTQLELDVIGALAGFSAPTWNGPALPRPEGTEGLDEFLDTVGKLIARAEYLIQAKDALSITYTINNITATAERFLLGTEEQVQQAADLRGLLTLVEKFLNSIFPAYASRIADALATLRAKVEARLTVAGIAYDTVSASGGTVPATVVTGRSSTAPIGADYSAFTLEDPSQFAMTWTTFEDTYRKGYPLVAEYSAAITDAGEATRQFWLTLRSSALPYNLLVLQKLTEVTAMPFQNNFGTSWLPEYQELLSKGRLYGIDMTIFEGLEPQQVSNGTLRFTPSTMTLLQMNDQKELTPIAVYAADPNNINNAQTYVPSSPAWIYGLLAAKTSLTVYGIWLGHVYTQHIVTAPMQMATWDTLPASNIIYQLLAPQSQYTIAFDLLLMLGWASMAPPTSISDTGKFLSLCGKFAATHDFFATDPHTTLARLNLDPADFTNPAIDDKAWNLYPNVQKTLQVWQMTADYVSAVVDAGYATDGAVAADADLAAWIGAASGAGNVVGLPRMDSKTALKAVATSVLYRITYHGMGRLRSMGTPLPAFAPNYPPCLQSATIPNPETPLSTAELLKTYLPNTGTLGVLISFYDIFAFSEPYVPAVPYKGVADELFYDEATHPGANQALIAFRNTIQGMIGTLQPDRVQIGQWPRNIEL